MRMDPLDFRAPSARGFQFMGDALPSLTVRDANGALEVNWATCEEDVRAAQRLRHEVFAKEMGARLNPVGVAQGLDVDRFDAFCDHLLVREGRDEDDQPGRLVGTYRVLTPTAARRAGGFYIDSEFDLAPVGHLRAHAAELGRACVHSAWRSGGVIMVLWRALGSYMLARQLDTMIGCASIGLGDDGCLANKVWQRLQHTHMVAAPWQVRPRIALPLRDDGPFDGSLLATADQARFLADTPALLKGYLRCGARLMGPPALDASFNTADLPIMLRMDELTPRYRKHFLGGQ